VAPHPGGQWLATGSQDGTIRLWEVTTGRCTKTWSLDSPVLSVAWCPNTSVQLLSAAVDNRVVLLPSTVGGSAAEAAAAAALDVTGVTSVGDGASLATWTARADGGVDIVCRHPVTHVTWHGRGDYFASVAPAGATQVGGWMGGGWL